MANGHKNGNGKGLVVKEAKFEIGTIKANEVIETIVNDFKQGIDFAVVIKGKKPTLLVPGADKLAFRFNLMAQFSKDSEALEMLSHVKGLIAFKCELVSRNDGKKVGEGRGAAVLGEGGNCKDPNSTIKMAEIRAKRDAILNTFPVRDRYTQDLEDLKTEETKLTVDSEGNVSL